MKGYFITLSLIASFLFFEGCLSSKMNKMKNKEDSTFSCDLNSGICSSNESNNKQRSMIESKDSTKLKLIYYYDALCGWCYGFSPVISKIQENYKDKITIEVISGGLFLGNRAGFVNDVAPHIKAGAYKSVEARTDVKFGNSFLTDVFGEGKMTLNSLPPSIALCIVREKYPDKELAFAEMLLKAVYSDGINPINIEEYKDYIAQIGLPYDEFYTCMKEDKYKAMALDEFETFKNIGFTGMPTLIVKKGQQEILLSNGYIDYDELVQRVKPFLE